MESKEKILRAALRVFLTKGYDAASMSDVVRESNYTKGGIYHHFKNKKQLFISVIDLLFRELIAWEKELYAADLDLENIIKTYYLALSELTPFLKKIAQSQDIREANFYLLMVDAFVRFPELKQKHYETQLQVLSSLEDMLRTAQKAGKIRSDLDCKTLSFMISALGEGTIIYHILNQKLDLQEIGYKLYDIIWKSIKIQTGVQI